MKTTSASVPSDDTMINVVGSDIPHPYGQIKDAVLRIGGEYYFRHDTDHLVRVKDQSGKKRFFRKKSKLVVEIRPGTYVHRSSVIRSPDGVLYDKNDPDTVFVNGVPTRKEWTVTINNEIYLLSDPRIKICNWTSEKCLIDDMVQLEPSYYGDDLFVTKKLLVSGVVVKTTDGKFIYAQDSVKYLNAAGDICTVHVTARDPKYNTMVFLKFKDTTNPQLDRIDQIYTEDKYTMLHDETGYRVHKAHYNELDRIYRDIILIRMAEETEALKKVLNARYADAGPDENNAKMVKKISQAWPGKYNIYTPTVMSPVISKTFSKTGGIKYTYGIEIETSQGLVPNHVAEKAMMRIVGDRSIGAGEYVTGVMSGDDGIELLKKQCSAISRYCLVDDRCGIHVHVGVEYDRVFVINAIKLATQIEPELYATMPPSRKPTMKHCHSVMRWKDINDKNWREYLGAFAHGPEESWNTPFSFAGYTFGRGEYTRRRKLGEFCGGRYKWLNLVHLLSKSNISTCELRIFPGSTNFEKIYNYVLLSLAFVWFAQNKMGRIQEGNVTLEEMLRAPFQRYPELADRLVYFYDTRKKRFNRSNLYPSSIPKAIF